MNLLYKELLFQMISEQIKSFTSLAWAWIQIPALPWLSLTWLSLFQHREQRNKDSIGSLRLHPFAGGLLWPTSRKGFTLAHVYLLFVTEWLHSVLLPGSEGVLSNITRTPGQCGPATALLTPRRGLTEAEKAQGHWRWEKSHQGKSKSFLD